MGDSTLPYLITGLYLWRSYGSSRSFRKENMMRPTEAMETTKLETAVTQMGRNQTTLAFKQRKNNYIAYQIKTKSVVLAIQLSTNAHIMH